MSNDSQLGANSLYALHLMSCALRGKAAMALPAQGQWRHVLAIAQSNSVAATCAFSAADAASVSGDAEVAAQWRAEADQNLFRIANFEMQREAVLADMQAAGLSWLLLKGSVVGPLYPHAEMRWMCDNDILFGFVKPDGRGGFVAYDGERSAKELRRIMEAHGFTTAHFGVGHHDSYEKQPFFNFEMHTSLVSPTLEWWRYYEQPWSRARKGDQPGAFEFSHEDVYVFHIAHTYKHFSAGGCGVRCIADEWVLLNAWGDTLNWDYINQQLHELGMDAFEADLRRVTAHVIDEDACGQALRSQVEAARASCGSETAAQAADEAPANTQLPSGTAMHEADCEAGHAGTSAIPRANACGRPLNQADAKMLAYMLGSGTYGTVANNVANKIQKNRDAGETERMARARYLAQRAFPKRELLESGYPLLKKHPWTLPAIYAYRLVVRPFTNHGRISAELRAFAAMPKEKDE